MKRHTATIMLTLLSCFVNLVAQDWPQYLGPDRNSTSTQKGILRSWPEAGPEVLWNVNIGIGYGGPVAKDGKVYLLDRNDEAGDIMRCFELATGKELWKFEYSAPGAVMFPGSRSVPALDGNYLYSCGPYGDLYCFDINTHKPVWNKNVWKDYGGEEIPKWAIVQCPLVFGDLLIVASQAPQAGVVAYDKLNGNVKWKTEPIGPVGYVSPMLVKVGSENHVVMITAAQGRGASASGGKVVGIESLTGKILWEYGNWQCAIPVPGALDAGDGRMLISGGYQAGSVMLKVEKNAVGSYGVTELFRNLDFGAHTQPPVLANGNFYAQYSTNERKDGLVCMTMDGKVTWKTSREPAFDKGGMIVADGLILATDGWSKLYLIEPDAAAFKPIASAVLLKEGTQTNDPMASRAGSSTQNWAPIAIIEGKLLIRDQQSLMCVRITE